MIMTFSIDDQIIFTFLRKICLIKWKIKINFLEKENVFPLSVHVY